MEPEIKKNESEKSNEAPVVETNLSEIPEEVIVPKLSEEEKAKIATEDEQHLETEKSIIEAADNPEFIKKILPEASEKVDAKVLDRALETLLNADGVELSRTERMKLFQVTLEYYSSPTETMLPLWHSTSSFSLRNGLEIGFKGGFGFFTGEQGQRGGAKNEYEVQKDLSISHPRYDVVETFQQMFARNTVRKADLGKQLAVDSEKITGETLPEVVNREFFGKMSRDELTSFISERTGVKPNEITDEYIAKYREEAVNKFNNIEYTDSSLQLEMGYLPAVEDPKLRGELEEEIKNHFPCFITFEGGKKMQSLHTVSQGEKPTHIPFEDRFFRDDKFTGEDIREIRVPQNQMEKVQNWLEAKGLKGIKIVPIEVYEIKRIIQGNVKNK